MCNVLWNHTYRDSLHGCHDSNGITPIEIHSYVTSLYILQYVYLLSHITHMLCTFSLHV